MFRSYRGVVTRKGQSVCKYKVSDTGYYCGVSGRCSFLWSPTHLTSTGHLHHNLILRVSVIPLHVSLLEPQHVFETYLKHDSLLETQHV